MKNTSLSLIGGLCIGIGVSGCLAERKIPEITIQKPMQDAGKVFRVPAPGAMDDWKNVEQSLKQVLDAGPGAQLVFQKGVYDFSAHPGFGAHLHLQNLEDVVIDGNGATLLMHPSNTFLEMSRCQRVEVKNFTLDYTMPHHMQGDIVEVADDFSTFTVKPHLGYPYSEGFPKLAHPPELEPVVFILYPDRKEIKYIEELGNDHLRTTFEILEDQHLIRYTPLPSVRQQIKNLSVGDRLVAAANYGTGYHNMLISRSSDCLLENITAYSSGAMNISPANNEGPIVLRGIVNKIKPGSDNIVSTVRDGIHCRSNRGPLLIEGCYFEGLMDDSINIFVLGSVCNGKTADGALLAGRGDHDEPVDFYRPGDKVAFYNPETGAYLAVLTVREAAPQQSKKGRANDYTIQFEEPLPEAVVFGRKGAFGKQGNSTQIFNLNACAEGSVVRRNVFKTQRRHALFISAPNSAFVDNEVDGVHGSAVCGGTQGHYVCGPAPHGLIVRGNRIRHTGWEAIKLYVEEGRENFDPATSPLHSVLIEDNEIALSRNKAISLTNVRDVLIQGNRISTMQGSKRSAEPIEIKNCLNVTEQ